MWWARWGWGCGAALLLLLLFLLLGVRRRRKHAPRLRNAIVHQVHIVRDSAPNASRLLSPPFPARVSLTPLTAPPPPEDTPQIVVVPTAEQPSTSHPTSDIKIPKTSSASEINISKNPISDIPKITTNPTSDIKIPKIPLPERWLHKRPFDYKYPPIPRPLAQIATELTIPRPFLNQDLGADLNQEARAKKYSATRSPSLEKDDKSPFLSSAKSVDNDVFGFDAESVKKVEGEMMTPKDDESPGNLRMFQSVSTRLNMRSVSEGIEGNEKIEMQNSPRLECSSAKETTTKFDFSPKITDVNSPRFFTPPETVSPMFFAEPSPKSVYYDTVRSPKFFPETPRESEVPQSPRAFGGSRNGVDKPSSPRILSAKPSPKIHSCNKENYFTFEPVAAEEMARIRPKKYGGRNSIERERFTPPADKEIKRYRRHNSCDTNYKNVEINVTTYDEKIEMKTEIIANETEESKDEIDFCAKMETLKIDSEIEKIEPIPAHSTEHMRRQRLKSISLDSDNARIIEQNLGLPIAKQMKDQMNEAYKNQDVSTSYDSLGIPKTPKNEKPIFKFDDVTKDTEEESKSPDLVKKSLRQSSDTQSFLDMPRFSPKEFEITVTTEEGATVTAEMQTKRKGKNLRNLTIDLTKRDSDLEKELLEFEKLYEEKKVKTPTLKVKATSLDSSDSANLSLPQKKTLEVPQNSISVPNTPKRQLKRILAQKNIKHDLGGGKIGFNSLQCNAERRLYMKGQDSGIFLRENHAALMLYQPGTSRMGSRTIGSLDENMADFSECPPEINVSGTDNRYPAESGHTLGSNLLNYKQNLSVSSTNLKTLPEGVTSDDFEPTEDEKVVKKLHRRNSNQSILLSTHSLQSSNCSLNSSGTSSHNLNIGTVRTSVSNFSLNSDSRQKKLSLERRDSNTVSTTEHLAPRVICTSNTNLSGEVSKNCLLQRRGSNNSLTLNINATNLSRHSSNSSLNKDAKPTQKKGLLERRSSNTSLTLNINNSTPQLSVNRGLSVSNYNLDGSTCNLSRYNSNYSIDNTEQRKGILERRNSNTSLTLNLQPQEPRALEIDDTMLEPNLTNLPQRDKHRKSLSTENLLPKSYKTSRSNAKGFGSHDNLWSTSYTEQEYTQNLTYVGGDQENEIIYAFGRQEDTHQGFVKNITTKPLSPQSTSEDFRSYLANMHHLQNASSVLSRQQLKDLNNVFQNGYSKVKCEVKMEGQHCCSNKVDSDLSNPQMVIPELSQPCSEYQKMLLRGLHQEFWEMPTNLQEKPIVSGSHSKNRYKAILPNEHSRFLLQSDAGVANEGYINANFIKGHEYSKNSYIATQGPLQNTIYDFWLMVHQNNQNFYHHPHDPGPSSPGVQKIVMLTNFIENNRQKCEKYFPLALNEEITFYSPVYVESTSFFDDTEMYKNRFVIKNIGMVRKSGYTIRKLHVRYEVKLNARNCDSDSKPDTGGTEQASYIAASESDRPSEDSQSEIKSASEVSQSEMDSADGITVYHYWFKNWADHKCPKDVNALLNLSLDVLKDSEYDFCDSSEMIQNICNCESPEANAKFVFPPLESEGTKCDITIQVPTPLDFTLDQSPPAIIHCSAGIGRTGCLIAILNGIKQLMNEQKVDVLGIVCNMRLNRGGMVQNSEQYELIHKVLCLFEQACLPEL